MRSEDWLPIAQNGRQFSPLFWQPLPEPPALKGGNDEH